MRYRFRIDDRHTVPGGKPEFAIACLDARRIHSSIALDIQHAVDLAISRRCNLLQIASGKCVQVVLTYPVYTSTAAYPEVTMRIFENPKYAVIKETVLDRIGGKFPVLEAHETAVISSNPHCSVVIFVERPDVVAWQTIVFGPAGKLPVSNARQTAITAHP